MLQAIGCVKQAIISNGSGMIDFLPVFETVKPDLFIVNEDGNLPGKKELCEQNGVEYLVLQRTPRDGLEPRSTTSCPGWRCPLFHFDMRHAR